MATRTFCERDTGSSLALRAGTDRAAAAWARLRGAPRRRCCSASTSGENQRWAMAVGTIAESTTTVTSSENWVRSMIPALSP